MAKKTTMLTPVIKAYNDWCEQWEKGLGEAEKFQKQMLGNTYSAIEKLPTTEAALKPMQLNALDESYTQIRRLGRKCGSNPTSG
jgi:hypothetical protein